MGAADLPTVRLLTGLFLRRLLHNDLISPDADRHDSLGVLYAVILSLAVFVTFFVATPYLSAFVQLPGTTALSAIPDRFLFIAVSMTTCALAALLVWDALTLEPRDAAILGPLPLTPWTITRAKLLAVLASGAVVSIAVNVVPIVLYPTFLTLNLRGTSGGGLLRLMAAQAIAVVSAGLFGFFAVLALRGTLHLGLGVRGFSRISSAVQSVLIVCAVSTLILTPTVSGKRVGEWVAGVVPPRYAALPVLWHLGVNETIAGDVLVDTPLVAPRRITLPAWLSRQDEEERSAYRTLRPNFVALARTGWMVLPALISSAIVLFLWNNRRLPEQSAGRPSFSRSRAMLRTIAARLTRGDPEAQAGFFFTLQTLSRSGPHRMVVAVSVGAALTFPFITLILNGAQWPAAATTLGVFSLHIKVLLVLIAGFRYAVIVPAELVANWTIRMAWWGDERAYLAGVKRAGTLLSVIAPQLVLLPLHVASFGIATAFLHALFGSLFAIAVLNLSFLGYRRVPFACSYLPFGDPKLIWSAGAAIILLVPYVFAFVERAALRSTTSTVALVAILGGIVLLIKVVDQMQRREHRPLNFDERPAPPTQRLGVFEGMAIHD